MHVCDHKQINTEGIWKKKSLFLGQSAWLTPRLKQNNVKQYYKNKQIKTNNNQRTKTNETKKKKTHLKTS